ncbi:pterin-4-alpha-carbinolamine dehydratase [Planoprotostelium fungivorum]|uniref:4a-hydroxytetrahydrobiopterin dehydratase n=1 Tax=Planoprotostelium fungivorum TaxID=1890364 RepID=A0A2P6MPN6_9EUKA|nr:pterin-4-alpha-carbinolamine dehydratase [Planoprotostelium fungivorum]
MSGQKLVGSERQEALSQIPQWKEAEGRDAIKRTFQFKDFKEAWAWMNKVADVADKVFGPYCAPYLYRLHFERVHTDTDAFFTFSESMKVTSHISIDLLDLLVFQFSSPTLQRLCHLVGNRSYMALQVTNDPTGANLVMALARIAAALESAMELIKKSVFYFSENGSPVGVGFCVENQDTAVSTAHLWEVNNQPIIKCGNVVTGYFAPPYDGETIELE